MSILTDKPHDFICLATAVTKHSQCSQNVFNFVNTYKAISYFPHDALSKKLSSYIWVHHNTGTAQLMLEMLSCIIMLFLHFYGNHIKHDKYCHTWIIFKTVLLHCDICNVKLWNR